MNARADTAAPASNAAPTDLATLRQLPALGPDVKVDFFSKNGFELACRIARALSTADALPAPFRNFNEKKEKGGTSVWVENQAALGNCLVAIEVSNAIGMSTVSVMQNADVIQGKLRWSSKFQIAAINASGRFSPLKYKLKNLGRITAKYKEKQGWNKQLGRFDFVEHTVEIDNWECVCWAYELDANKRPTQEICQSIPVSMKMAVEEGWYAKEGSKWQGEMRFQMLQYRAGTFFGSIYAPDIIMGMGKSTEDAMDITDVVMQSDGGFAAGPASLQELRSAPDGGSIPTTSGESHGEDGPVETESHAQNSTSASSAQASPGGEGAASSNPAGGPTVEDALASVNAGNFDEARDFARSLTDEQRKQVEVAITSKQSSGATAPASRRSGSKTTTAE